MSVQSLILNAATRLHFSISRKPPAMLRNPRREFKLSLELAAARLALRQDEAFVVQVGAHDGSSDDPLFQTIQRLKWSALLLEPQPEAFAKLQQNYREFPQVQTVNVALSDHDGTQTLHYVDSALKEPYWASELASFDANHILKQEKYIPNLRQYLRQAEVPCQTFDALFAQYHVDKVDVLQIDTEGFDAEVLRLFDVPRRLPTIINFEHKHLSMKDWDQSVQTLLDCGYEVAKTGSDTLAYRMA